LVVKHAELHQAAQKGMKELVIDYAEAKQTIKALRNNTRATERDEASIPMFRNVINSLISQNAMLLKQAE